MRLIAAMLAPYLSDFFRRQSDFGHPAGAVLANRLFRTFLNLAYGMERSMRTQRVIAVPCLFWNAD
jgi:hypothetical protein